MRACSKASSFQIQGNNKNKSAKESCAQARLTHFQSIYTKTLTAEFAKVSKFEQ